MQKGEDDAHCITYKVTFVFIKGEMKKMCQQFSSSDTCIAKAKVIR
jgi:hypothetical protein